MLAGNVGNRHAGLGSFCQDGHLLTQGIAPATLDPGKNVDSISTVSHRRMTRRKPSSYLRTMSGSNGGCSTS